MYKILKHWCKAGIKIIKKKKKKNSWTNGILNRLKRVVPMQVKLALYNSLVLSHINYGLLAWGHVQERIFKLQKKSVRIITCSKYNAHSMPIFKKLKMLKLEDIYYCSYWNFIISMFITNYHTILVWCLSIKVILYMATILDEVNTYISLDQIINL